MTGSSGFIGQKLTLKLLDLGHDVTGIDLVKTTEARFREIEIDFSNEKIEHYLNEDTVLIHLAAISTDSQSRKSPLSAIDTNIYGTQKLLELCTKAQVRKFIFASSEWVYPETTNLVEQYESDIVSTNKLNSVYAMTKLVSEDLVRVTSGDLDYSILRFGIVYGPRILPGSSLESLVMQVCKNDEIEIGNRRNARNFIFIDDLVNGIIQCIFYGKSSEVYNLSGDESISLEKIINITGDKLNKKVKFKDLEKLVSIRNPINNKAKKDLKWSPKVSIENGIENCLNLFQGV